MSAALIEEQRAKGLPRFVAVPEVLSDGSVVYSLECATLTAPVWICDCESEEQAHRLVGELNAAYKRAVRPAPKREEQQALQL